MSVSLFPIVIAGRLQMLCAVAVAAAGTAVCIKDLNDEHALNTLSMYLFILDDFFFLFLLPSLFLLLYVYACISIYFAKVMRMPSAYSNSKYMYVLYYTQTCMHAIRKGPTALHSLISPAFISVLMRRQSQLICAVVCVYICSL